MNTKKNKQIMGPYGVLAKKMNIVVREQWLELTFTTASCCRP